VEVLNRRAPRLSASETEIYAHAGLVWLPPETRGAPDAMARAQQQSVPRLVQREDIRGDLHMHSTYSDGREPLRRMVLGALALGYEYIAITDHSEHAGASRTLTPDLLERQRVEIAQLRQELPRIAILHGMEVDIMPDGSLDCPDEVLASLDIVLASLHDAAGQNGARLTGRCLAAIAHPLVSVITHPANQLVGRRAGYDMDYGAIYAAAAETGTALEIDGAPAHLDLSGERAGEAVNAGVTVVIDSDCHRVRSLDRQMRMGVGTARRGWVEARHALNTRPVGDVRAFVARKRAR
jgi:DNA polymerase (family X)